MVRCLKGGESVC